MDVRPHVRLFLVAGLLLASVAPAFAQKRDGVFKASDGKSTPWKINENHTLVWGGEPYIPIGIRIDGDPKSVEAAAQAGVKDVIVDLPASGAGWSSTLQALEAAHLRYLIRVSSLAPTAEGYAVEPQAYRVAGISTPRDVSVEIPGASAAFTVLASRRDSSIAFSGPATINKGTVSVSAKPGGQIEHVLLLYPRLTSLDQPDFWEKFDARRDAILSALRANPPGPGFRGLVNPAGKAMKLPGRSLEFVPTSPAFRAELREALERKYSSIVTALRSWGMGTNTIQNFDDMARLVPLWQGSRGVGQFLDPDKGVMIPADMRNNTAWRDLAEAVNAAGARRYSNLVAAVRSVVDAPVVQEWAGWSAPYEGSAPAFDGVGMRAAGVSPSDIADTGSRAASTVLRWNIPGWLPATDVDLGAGVNASTDLNGVTEDLLSMGARAVFFRAEDPKVLAATVQQAAARQDGSALASTSPNPIFYPENATNPASVQRLPGNNWWLPAPSDGDRIDLGPDFFAYRMRQRQIGNALAIWARTPGRYRLRLVNAKGVTFSTLDGSDPAPKNSKGGIEVNLTQFPLLVVGTEEVVIPEPAYVETMREFEQLVQAADAQHRDVSEERIGFRDALNGFDRNPGGNFSAMRNYLYRLGAKVGNSTWIEGEVSGDTNFSEVGTEGSCSGGKALMLSTPFSAGSEGYHADYSIPVKTGDEQTVWVAARIPRELRDSTMVQLAGQAMVIRGEPVGLYGDGFGWYKLGVTRLSAGPAKLRILCNGAKGADLAVDVIVLTPAAWQPSGVLNRPLPVQN